MARCVMVVGIPRSGTSATAGLLHNAGVPMERISRPLHPLNPVGFFEDVRWMKAHNWWGGADYYYKRPNPGKQAMAEYRKLAARYDKGLWGMKHPRLCYVARYIWPLLEDVRVVAVWRDPEASARSLISHNRLRHAGNLGIEEARRRIAAFREAMRDTLGLWRGPLLEVQFEELLADPPHEARRICDFAVDGLGVKLNAAKGAAFVDPRLDHGGDNPVALRLARKG